MAFQINASRTHESLAITKRRETNAKYTSFENIVAEDRKYGHILNWEIKSQDMMDRNTVANLARGLESTAKQKLQLRQRKLAELYQKDEAIQRQHLAALRETSEQKARRLVTKARELKKAREEKRKTFAQDMYNKQWIAACDDLRNIGSEQYMRYCREQIADQRQEKAQRQSSEQREEAEWARLWEEERLKRIEEENEQQRQRQRLNYETKLSVLGQIDQSRNDKLAKAYTQELEREEFRHQLADDSEYARQAKENAALLRRQQMVSILRYNEQRDQALKNSSKVQREQELRDLSAKMEEYKADMATLAGKKDNLRMDMANYIQYMKQRKEEERAFEKMIEKLSIEEQERVNRKQDVITAREQTARDQLNSDVYLIRGEQLVSNEEERHRVARELEMEKYLVLREASQASMEEREEERAFRSRELASQADMIRQMHEKRNKERMSEALIIEEREDAIEAERQYRAFVQREKAKAAQGGEAIPASVFH